MKIITLLFESVSNLVRWLTANPSRMIVVLGFSVALPLGLILGSMIFSGNESTQGAAWREYFQAREEVISGRQDIDWLKSLVLYQPQGDFKGNALRESTEPKLWALQFCGDTELSEGARLIYVNRDDAAERLGSALEFYELIEESDADGVLMERCLLGKAHSLEILLSCSSRERDFTTIYEDAISTLRHLSTVATNSAIKDAATQRHEVLLKYGKDHWEEGRIASADFYSWLANFTPPEPPLNPFPTNPLPPGPMIPSPTPFPGEGELLPPPVLFNPADFPLPEVPPGLIEELDPGIEGDDPADTPSSQPEENGAGDPQTP
tara:strand:- start:68 stop:1030 length:963 start_codon:yes stop_codon:yes gene_type:complete